MYDLEKHIENLINVYRKRRDLMLDTMEKEFPTGVTFHKTTGWIIYLGNLPRIPGCSRNYEEIT